METIISIKEFDYKNVPEVDYAICGYVVETNENLYYFAIEDVSFCCEEYGYISAPSDYKDFIGADIHNINYATKIGECKIDFPKDLYQGDCAFAIVETNRGDLQFGVYNVHNGFYEHAVVFFKRQKHEGGGCMELETYL